MNKNIEKGQQLKVKFLFLFNLTLNEKALNINW